MSDKLPESQNLLGHLSLVTDCTVTDLLVSLGQTRTQIKKSGLSKNFLEKKWVAKSELEFDLANLNKGIVNPTYLGPQINILFEDENFLVLSKPGGVHQFPMKYSEQNTVHNFLRASGKTAALNVDKDKHERGALYRLDQATSGLLIFAKNESCHHLIRNNKDAIKSKIYLAVVYDERGQAEANLLKSIKWEDGFLGLAHGGPKVRVAGLGEKKDLVKGLIEVLPICYNKSSKMALLGIKLHHGHRHQIRAQLAYHNLPIIHDELYSDPSIFVNKEKTPMFLHALSYSIEISGKTYNWLDNPSNLWRTLFDLDSGLEVLRNHLWISQ